MMKDSQLVFIENLRNKPGLIKMRSYVRLAKLFLLQEILFFQFIKTIFSRYILSISLSSRHHAASRVKSVALLMAGVSMSELPLIFLNAARLN